MMQSMVCKKIMLKSYWGFKEEEGMIGITRKFVVGLK